MSDTYWHLFTGVVADPEMHVTSVFGPSTLAPDDLTEDGIPVREVEPTPGYGTGTLTYAASFDHEPTEAEKAVHTPERFQESR